MSLPNTFMREAHRKHGDALRRGDLSFFNQGGAEVFESAKKTGRFSPFVFSYRIEQNNRNLVLPCLPQAVDGIQTARKFYDSTRYFGLLNFPECAHQAVLEEISHALERFPHKERLPPFARLVYLMSETMGLNSLCTYENATEFMQRARQERYPNGFSAAASNKIWFSPCHPSPIGRHCLLALEKIIPFMRNVQLLEDWSSFHGINLPDSFKLELARSVRGSSWKILTNSRLQCCLDAWNVLTQHSGIQSPQERIAVFHEALQERDPERALRIRLGLIPSEDARSVTKQAREAQVPLELPKPKAVAAGFYKQNFIAGLLKAFEIHHPTITEKRELAQKFFGLYRRGICDYQQIIEALRSGTTPTEVFENFYLAHSAKLRALKAIVPQRTPAQEAISDGSGETKEERAYTVTVYRTPEGAVPFQEWLASIDNSMRPRIEAHLFRLEMGPPTNCKQVRRGLWSMSLTFGPGYRILFTHDKRTRETLILIGGDKRSQDDDIRKAEAYLKCFQKTLGKISLN